MHVRLVPLLIGSAMLAASLCGCATTRVHPGLFTAQKFAIASIHARRSIDLGGVRVAPVLSDNELGAEVVEMELGETEVRLAEILGAEVLPVGKALEQKVYDKLPEAWPPEEWSQVNDIIAVDVDAPGAAPVLGALAQALKVDGVIVLRHEFSLARDRYEVAAGATAFDRCTILIVDDEGRKIWEEVVLARIPVHTFMSGQFAVGLQYATWADEARQLSRRTAREALEMFARRFQESKKLAQRGDT